MRYYVTPSYPALCDNRFSKGWYCFVEAAGTKTLTNHGARFGCGTVFSGWLDGAHPSVEDGQVSKTVCFTYTPTSCKDTKGIFVKNCGSYNVYKLF